MDDDVDDDEETDVDAADCGSESDALLFHEWLLWQSSDVDRASSLS